MAKKPDVKEPSEQPDPEVSEQPQPLGMDEQPPQDARPPDGEPLEEAGPELRQGTNVICPYHNLKCVAKRTDALVTRYYCPEPGCGYMQKVPRPDFQKRLNRSRARERQQEGFSARE